MAPFLSDDAAAAGRITESISNIKLGTSSEGDAEKSKYLPVANPTESFWQEEPHELHNHRSTEELPSHTDILIIGAGYAGVSTAYHLIQDEKTKKSITILEARGACSGATGRNGGHLRPDLYGHIPTYIERGGAEAGAEIARFEIAHVQAIKKIVEKENIECDFTLMRSYDIWCNEEAAGKAREIYERMKSEEGCEYMDDVVFYDGKDVEGVRDFSIFILEEKGLRESRFVALKARKLVRVIRLGRFGRISSSYISSNLLLRQDLSTFRHIRRLHR
jgi:hypothetical protein